MSVEGNLRPSRLDSTTTVLSASLVYVAAMLVTYVMPAILGVIADRWELGGSQLGIWAGAYSLGLAIVSLSSISWLHRFDCRKVMAVGLALCGICFGAQSIAEGFEQLTTLMFIAGCGGGMAASPSLAVLGRGVHAQRNFGIMIFLSVALPFLVIVSVPYIETLGGYRAILLSISAILFFVASLALTMPSEIASLLIARREDGERRQSFQRPGAGLIAALLGMAVFVAGFVGAWYFVERIGEVAALPNGPMLNSIAIGQLIGGLGGFLAIWLAIYLSFTRSFLLSIAITVAVLLSLEIIPITITTYSIVITLFMLWVMANFSNIMTFISSIDAGGRYVATIPGLQNFGAFVGSTVAGSAFAFAGPSGVIGVSVAAFVVCAACMIFASRSYKNTL